MIDRIKAVLQRVDCPEAVRDDLIGYVASKVAEQPEAVEAAGLTLFALRRSTDFLRCQRRVRSETGLPSEELLPVTGSGSDRVELRILIEELLNDREQAFVVLKWEDYDDKEVQAKLGLGRRAFESLRNGVRLKLAPVLNIG